MEFRIADTFIDSLTRLTGDEQKAVKTTAFDLQLNPSQPGLQLHKLDKPRDPNFSSVRVNKDVRLIVHKTAESLLLCYVDHHDKAYQWAERRKLETHPKTGAAQLVEIKETIREIVVPRYVEEDVETHPQKRTHTEALTQPSLFASTPEDQLLAYGVPVEWLSQVRQATEDTLLALTDHLPVEAAEALLQLATGGTPEIAKPVAVGSDPFAHPDAQRRFRVMRNVEELELALEFPWEKWTVFLHPSQKQLVERRWCECRKLQDSKNSIFDYVVVDEAQDMGIPHLRFFAALAANRPNGLFLAGDLGQRIFQQPFSWKALGVDVRGRSRTLRVNYRTSHQIRMQADRLLGPDVSDVDGNKEDRKGTVSVFNGPPPLIRICKTQSDESATIGKWIADLSAGGVLPHEFGVFVRSDSELERARSAVAGAGLEFTVLDSEVETLSGRVSIGTMHLAKGLEFRAVAVMACDDEVIPSQQRVESVTDDAELEEVYNTERHLLYVACTRARDHLLVTGVAPGSEFLVDLTSRNRV